MPETKRFPPDDPREWLNRARSDLALAKAKPKGVLLEDLCFHTQQAAEKAIKAVLIQQKVEFPYVHDLAQLLLLTEKSGIAIPPKVLASVSLTRFAVMSRYPGVQPSPTEDDYREALQTAEEIVRWAENHIKTSST